MKLSRNIVQVNRQRLTEFNFWCDLTCSTWQPWRYFARKVLPSGDCTCSVCPVHIQQHPPVTDPQYICTRFFRSVIPTEGLKITNNRNQLVYCIYDMPGFLKMNFWSTLMFITAEKQILEVLAIELSLVGRQTLHLKHTTDTGQSDTEVPNLHIHQVEAV